MQYDVGDIAHLTATTRDSAGNLASAGTMTVTVTATIDGTVTGPTTRTPDSTGQYSYDLTITKAGWHDVSWLATGVNSSAWSTGFDVSDFRAWISVDDLRTYMKKTTTDDDEELRGFIGAGCQMIRDRVGEVVPVSFTEDVPWDRCAWPSPPILLKNGPVLSITSVQTLPGLDTVPQADLAAGTYGWLLTQTGLLVHTSGWSSAVRVAGRAGRTPTPGNFRLAALELTSHLWQQRKLNSGGGRPAPGADSSVLPGSTFAFPIRVRELLGLNSSGTSEVLMR